jgi:chromosome segregation ATPase
MVFGAQKGSGISGLRGAVNDEAAVSSIRLKGTTDERHRIEKERAKASIEEKKRQLQHAKLEISSHEAELRRVTGELKRAEMSTGDITEEVKKMEEAHAKTKEEAEKMNQEIEALHVRITHLTNDLKQKRSDLIKMESQKSYKGMEASRRTGSMENLKQKKMRTEGELQRLHTDVTRLEQEIKRLESLVETRK